MLNKAMQKGVIVTMLVFGLLLTTAAPSALADGKKRCNNERDYYTSSYYDNNRYDNDRYNDRYDRDRNYRRDSVYRDSNYYDDYNRYDRRDSRGRTIRNVGIGAAIGAGGGALFGGKKGALIGAAIGAAGGYVYNQKKRDRY